MNGERSKLDRANNLPPAVAAGRRRPLEALATHALPEESQQDVGAGAEGGRVPAVVLRPSHRRPAQRGHAGRPAAPRHPHARLAGARGGGEGGEAEGRRGGAGGAEEEGGEEGSEGVGLEEVRGQGGEPQQALRVQDGRVSDRSDGVDREIELYTVKFVLKTMIFL